MRSLCVLFIVALACMGIATKINTKSPARTGVAHLLTERDPPAGFATARRPRTFEFPADHSAHPRFRSEWWYFTGNTTSTTGKAFGFQVTIFRFALSPQRSESRSKWRRSSIYLGHFAISDIDAGIFHHFERRGRPALDLAGTRDNPLRIWIRDWAIELTDPDTESWRITAREAGVGLDLTLRAQRPVTPQGDRGLSTKSAQAGNASYYYSIPRLAAVGTIETPGAVHHIRGNAWFDHEWSTSALAEGQLGWDWFSLQLDDGSDLMLYQIRNRNHIDPASHGLLLQANGVRTEVDSQAIQLTVERHWRSPASGVRYPARWRLTIPEHDAVLTVTPRFPDQEWRKSFTYWEGAVEVSGVARGRTVTGTGYVELVGYE